MCSTRRSPVASPAPRLRRARAAVFLAFLLNGFVIALWVVSIPAVAARTGLTNAALGTTLLALGAGSVVAMQASGHLAARIGSRAVVGAGVLLLAAGLVLIATAANGVGLALALLVLGMGNGAIDVAMNDQAVVVERSYARPIMSAFHALFSVGGALGAACGALAQGLGLGYGVTLIAATVLVLAGGVIAAPGLLPRSESHRPPEGRDASSAPPAEVRRAAVLLGALAFAFMLAEGVVNDWSAVHATQHLGEDASTASLAYLVFAITMVVGRLAVDRVVAVVGPMRLVRSGSVAALVGLAVVVISSVYPLTLVGWMLFGAGLAGIVPQIFTAAGGVVPGRAGAIVLSRIVGAGYVGMLAGPAIIGWVSAAVGIDLALLVPMALIVLGVLLAPRIAPRRSSEGGAHPAGGRAGGESASPSIR